MRAKAYVLKREPEARLVKENLANNGTFHYTVRVGFTGRWLTTSGMHGTPREAWQGAMYALRRQQAVDSACGLV